MSACRPYAFTRSLSDSATFFSNPEYVWTMYQFLLSGRPSSLVATSVICSSPRAKLTEEPGHHHDQHLIEPEEVQPDRGGRENHDDGRGIDFLLRRPGDALQLVPDLAQEQPRALDAPARSLPDRLKGRRVRTVYRHMTSDCFTVCLLP